MEVTDCDLQSGRRSCGDRLEVTKCDLQLCEERLAVSSLRIYRAWHHDAGLDAEVRYGRSDLGQQYANSLAVKVTDKFHDRFLVIDQKTLIHIGASLNYLGKKCFGFSTMDAEMIPDILARIP